MKPGVMATLTHPCEADGCSVPVARDKFMCIRHWRMVPKPLRERVWTELWRYRRTARSAYRARWEVGLALREVQAQAIAAVREKELNKITRRAAREPSLGF